MSALPTVRMCEVWLTDNPSAVKHWSFGQASISLLATGRDNLLWQFAEMVDVIDSRGNTLRCRLFCEDGQEATALAELAKRAKLFEVTLQLLCVGQPIPASQETHDLGGGASVTVTEHEETYPVVWLNFRGQKWPTGTP